MLGNPARVAKIGQKGKTLMNFLGPKNIRKQEMSLIAIVWLYFMSTSSLYHYRGPSGAVGVIGHLVNALFHFFTTNFCRFDSQNSHIPHCAPTTFKSSIVIPLPISTLKFQPYWSTGVRATGRAIGQTSRKASKMIDFCRFFRHNPGILRHAQRKFESSTAIPLPIKTLKFQPNWPTEARAIGHAIRQTRKITAKIIDFCWFFSRYSHIPHYAPKKFKSSIAILPPILLRKFQPNWPTGS